MRAETICYCNFSKQPSSVREYPCINDEHCYVSMHISWALFLTSDPPPFHCWATNQFSLVNLPAFLSSFSSFFSASFHLPLLLKEVLNICVKTHCVLESRAQANLLYLSVLKIGHLITCMKSITKHLDMWFGIFNRELLYDDAYVLLITCDLNNVHTCLHIQHVNK